MCIRDSFCIPALLNSICLHKFLLLLLLRGKKVLASCKHYALYYHLSVSLITSFVKRNTYVTYNNEYKVLLLTLHKRYTFASELVPHVLLLPYHQEPKGRCNDPLGAHFI